MTLNGTLEGALLNKLSNLFYLFYFLLLFDTCGTKSKLEENLDFLGRIFE